MNHTASALVTRPNATLMQLLWLDAFTCVLTGLVLVSAASPLAGMTDLPAGLLFHAGLLLFPCAALMVAAVRFMAKPLLWAIIAGNFAWAAASVYIAFAFDPALPGFVLVLVQAAIVAGLGLLELRAARAERA
jgi:hypothetical protein